MTDGAAVNRPMAPAASESELNRQAYLGLIEDLFARRKAARVGGPETARRKHRERGKLLARERTDALIAPGSPFLELLLHLLAEPLLLPVFPPVAQGKRKREPGRSPNSRLGKRKSGAEVQRHRQHAGGDNIGARKVQVMD